MTIYNVSEEMTKKFDEIMQQKFEEFYIRKIAEAKANWTRTQKEARDADERFAAAADELYKIKNDYEYVKEMYHTKQFDITTNRTEKSQYTRDLEKLIMPV